MPRTRNITRNNESTQAITKTGEINHASRHRRRAKAPVGELGRKLKQQQKAAETSSLPPSSPILDSPMQHDSLPVATSEGVEPLTNKWWQEQEDDVEMDPNSEYYAMEEVDDPQPPQQHMQLSQDSDPFGFSAVEKMLKEERLKRPPPPAMPRSRPPLPPPINTRPLRPPRTPHKQGIRKRPAYLSSGGALDDATPSLPSSPSPVKPPTKRSITKEQSAESVAVREDEAEETETEQNLARGGKGRSKGKGKVGPRRKAREADDLAESDELLRKRPATHKLRKKINKNDDGSDVEDTGLTRGKGKGRARKKQGIGEIVVEDEEKWAQERKARLEYFKKLDNYKVHKENVYVV
ncbi:hypothetical protein VKT23_000481 [Stygiomarasmius scandens]|uniref:Uncharacterized protein n=1 Tax=Marasmiellus scandens TaxID=2682957 RepID=A0ABR1K4L9_9AGAR